MTTQVSVARAATYDEIRPLVDLCKAGNLFGVQDWIAAGRPVNPPPIPAKGRRGKTPLEIALEKGFHSLIQVLLEGGAIQEPDGWDSPMSQALRMRRFDVVKLLIAHGFDPKTVDMIDVFNSWDPELMEFFIDRGAEVEKGNPLAYALCSRVRTALRILKKYKDQFPTFEEQANIALRHHCKEKNLKWVSIMLWAGADPYKPGVSEYSDQIDDDDEGLSSLGYAALYGLFEVFKMRKLKLDPAHPSMRKVADYLCKEGGNEFLLRLLKMGLEPNDQPGGGCSAIDNAIRMMSWTLPRYYGLDEGKIDDQRCRERMKSIHILVKHGAKWLPEDKRSISDARRSLLALTPDYTVEFIWILSKYRASKLDHIQKLLGTPTIKAHIAKHRNRVQEIVESWNDLP